jgi:hypothetical protein
VIPHATLEELFRRLEGHDAQITRLAAQVANLKIQLEALKKKKRK